jgi:vacuolar-type H+-ATPase subunit E/Vma4
MADASKAAAAEFPKALMPDFSSSLGGGAGGGASASIAEPVIESINQVNEAQVEAARKEQEILDKRRDAFKSFRDSVKTLFGQIKDSIMSAFSLPDLGNSVNSITKNINKLLAQTKNFASNISKLSSMGLNSTLLQQVIAAGPQAGSRLAASLASGGSGVISQINQAYSEFGGLASGIAQTGTAGAFANRQTINNYSIAVTGGLATGADVGRAVVNAISSYERQSGAAWRA